jgi:hypothetical protein
MKQRQPQKKAHDVCGLGGCYAVKVKLGLFCARHWAMVGEATQKAYCDLYVSNVQVSEETQRQFNVLDVAALGEIARYIEAHPTKKGAKA